jgi:hypothetical protein
MRRAVLMTRQAISPRLAMRIFVNMAIPRRNRRTLRVPRDVTASLRGLAAAGHRDWQ